MEQSRAITRRSASNLALAFVILPKEKRQAISVLYAFCREVDDVADDESRPIPERRRLLEQWRADVGAACDPTATPAFPVNREFQPVIQQYRLPRTLLEELIRGCEMDLEDARYRTFEELELYCYRVASVVGLLSIEIFGYRNPACRDYAIYLGQALQLTNILRDVRTDAERGRIYLPRNEMERCGVSAGEILRSEDSARFRELAKQVAARARGFYQRARETLPPEDHRSMATAELMGGVYWRLLCKLEARGFAVLGSRPTRLTKTHKLFLILRSVWRLSSGGAFAPSYGTP